MPELPEVETMRRGVAPIEGCRIRDVVRSPCRLKAIEISPRLATFRRRVVGESIVAVDRVGKRVVLRLSGEQRVIMEPRMTGLVLLAEPPNRTHLRLVFQLDGGKAPELLFWDRRGLGSVRLVDDAEFAVRYGPDRIGPDALAVSAEELQARLAESRREIKVALLDQRVLAGVGNLYASEILHLAGIHPRRRCQRLTTRHWRAVHQALREVLESAILHEGSTLSDGTYRNALNQAGGYQNLHQVYDREGEICVGCARSRIVRIVQAQRSTFFCPTCQRIDKGA